MRERTDMSEKIAVIFPGIGYTCDKPLLYYAGKFAQENGYEVVRVPYGGFPKKVKGDRKKMEKSFALALDQSREMLSDLKWEDYEEILFISKSIGTAVAAAFGKEKGLKVRHVFFTPLKETFSFGVTEAVAFHGSADPWARDADIEEGCRKAGIPLYITEGANHSLETGDTAKDLQNLILAQRQALDFILGGRDKG